MTPGAPASQPDASLLDAVIVGGGPAGLSAALLLVRCRRRVLLCDAGQPRNAASRALHGFLTRDGIPPAEFLRLAREQLHRYPTIQIEVAEVREVQREDQRFTAMLANGASLRARALLLATGVLD